MEEGKRIKTVARIQPTNIASLHKGDKSKHCERWSHSDIFKGFTDAWMLVQEKASNDCSWKNTGLLEKSLLLLLKMGEKIDFVGND